MAITHFKINSISPANAAIVTVGGNPYNFGDLIQKNDQANTVFTRPALYNGISYQVNFNWQAVDNDNNIESEEESATILFWISDLEVVDPLGASVNLIVNQDTEIVFKDSGTFDDTVGFFLVKDIQKLNLWKLNGNPLSIGQAINSQDFPNLKLRTLAEGGGVEYSKLYLRAGNNTGLDLKDILLNVQVNVLATLTASAVATQTYQDDFGDPATTYDVTEETYTVYINEGQALGTAELTIVITSPFLAINSYNKVIISSGREIIETEINDTITLNVPLNNLGKGFFTVKNYIVLTNADPINGSVDITLDNIDTLPAVVDNSNNNVTLTTNL